MYYCYNFCVLFLYFVCTIIIFNSIISPFFRKQYTIVIIFQYNFDINLDYFYILYNHRNQFFYNRFFTGGMVTMTKKIECVWDEELMEPVPVEK